MLKNIGIQVHAPEQECNDINCPFHGELRCHGNTFTGVVASTKMQKTASVEWSWRRYIPKYERYELRRTRVNVHNTPCLNAKEGDIVRIISCRPLSKTKNFVIIEKLGIDVAYMVKRKTAKQQEETKEKLGVKEDATAKGKNN